jgi:hypothetical protein
LQTFRIGFRVGDLPSRFGCVLIDVRQFVSDRFGRVGRELVRKVTVVQSKPPLVTNLKMFLTPASRDRLAARGRTLALFGTAANARMTLCTSRQPSPVAPNNRANLSSSSR